MDDQYLNFHNVVNGIITLIKCSITNDWSLIMVDMSHTGSECNEEEHNCGSSYAYIYFIVFQIITNYFIMNIISLIILSQFQEFNSDLNNPFIIL